MKKFGIVLFIFSFLPWIAIIVMLPLLALPLSQKAIFGTFLAVFAEACFWVSVVILGKEVVSQYRRYLSPRYLWQCWQTFIRKRSKNRH